MRLSVVSVPPSVASQNRFLRFLSFSTKPRNNPYGRRHLLISRDRCIVQSKSCLPPSSPSSSRHILLPSAVFGYIGTFFPCFRGFSELIHTNMAVQWMPTDKYGKSEYNWEWQSTEPRELPHKHLCFGKFLISWLGRVVFTDSDWIWFTC